MAISWIVQTLPVLSFSPKRIAEVITLGFDFQNVLATNETIVSSLWYIIAIRPIDAPQPVSMLINPSVFSGTQTFQQVQSGTEGVMYNLVAQITTNFANVIEQGALLRTTNNVFEDP